MWHWRLGGLAGNNAYGAGVLQAALDKPLKPDMISCTSGQIHWVHRYLKARTQKNSRGELRRNLEAGYRRVEPDTDGSGGLLYGLRLPGSRPQKSGVSSSFLPEKMNRHRITRGHRITREKMNRHRITLTKPSFGTASNFDTNRPASREPLCPSG